MEKAPNSLFPIALVAAALGLCGLTVAQRMDESSGPPAQEKTLEGLAGLEGKPFEGWLLGPTRSDPAALFFESGRLRSSFLEPFGFEPASYTVKDKDGVLHFRAKSANSRDAQTMEWRGVVREGKVEASAVHTDTEGRTQTYRFKGDRN